MYYHDKLWIILNFTVHLELNGMDEFSKVVSAACMLRCYNGVYPTRKY